jgi:hypothetical protein
MDWMNEDEGREAVELAAELAVVRSKVEVLAAKCNGKKGGKPDALHAVAHSLGIVDDFFTCVTEPCAPRREFVVVERRYAASDNHVATVERRWNDATQEIEYVDVPPGLEEVVRLIEADRAFGKLRGLVEFKWHSRWGSPYEST